MAQLDNVYDSYDAVNVNKESLSDILTTLKPEQTPFMSMSGTETVTNTYHEWAYTTAVGATTNAQLEGDEFTNTSVTAPSRGFNYTQISSKVLSTTGTEQAVKTVGPQAEAELVMRYGLLLKNDMEAALCGNTAASAGTNNTTQAIRTLRSFEAWAPNANRVDSSNFTTPGTASTLGGTTTLAATDGTTGQLRAFTEQQLLTVLQQMYGAGLEPDTIIMNTNKAVTFSNFGGGATRQIDAVKQRIVNKVDFYVSPFGTVEAYVSRYVRPNSATVGRSVLISQKDMVKVGYLRPIAEMELAKTGDTVRKALVAEYTFVPMHPSALGVVADLSA